MLQFFFRLAQAVVVLAAVGGPGSARAAVGVGEIEVPPQVRGSVGSFLKIAAVTKGEVVRWKVVDPGVHLFPVELLKDSKTAVVTGIVPGRFRVWAWTATEAGPSEAAECVVEIDSPKPEPKPGPKPEPGPDPGPKPEPGPRPTPGGKLFIVVIEETAQATARRGEFFADSALAQAVTGAGHRWRVVDKDVVDRTGRPPADLEPYLKAASGQPLPYLFLVNSQGEALYRGPVPATPAGLVELLKRNGGGS